MLKKVKIKSFFYLFNIKKQKKKIFYYFSIPILIFFFTSKH
jgi:hypothetical protein